MINMEKRFQISLSNKCVLWRSFVESITHDLFEGNSEELDRVMHPADDLAR